MSLDLYPNHPGSREIGGTSEEAAEAIAPHASTLRGKVYALLQREDMTADEIAAALRESILSIRPRVSELAKSNLVHRTGKRRRNASGMNAAVWSAYAVGEQMPLPLRKSA